MLGRTDDALTALEGMTDAEAENLRATIRESRGDWAEALDSYTAAKAAWEAAAPSRPRAEGLLRATTGVAYCQRKLGRYDEAEAAYREVVKLAPTADSHFLLAQFYEDAQQTEPAREHARRAMALAPARYERRGKELIDKLAAYHFGCLGVFAAESRRSARGDGR
jgi:tetratricopeptide (TPR) repeat protein